MRGAHRRNTRGGNTVLLQSGRFHLYEGHSADVGAFAVRVFAALGIGTLILTNAAGESVVAWRREP